MRGLSGGISRLLTWLFMACLAVGQAGAADRVLTLSSSNVSPYSTPDRQGFEDLLATEIFRRLGYGIRIYDAPAERGLVQLNEGGDDGTLARNPGMAERYPNLVQFRESALEREYVAYTTGLRFDVSGWQSLAPYHVGIVTGWKILERNIGQSRSLTRAKDGPSLFRMLAAGRIDVAVFNRWGGYRIINRLGLVNVRPLSPALAKRKVYFYMHKRHADLVPKADAVLSEIKADGTYQRIFDKTVARLKLTLD